MIATIAAFGRIADGAIGTGVALRLSLGDMDGEAWEKERLRSSMEFFQGLFMRACCVPLLTLVGVVLRLADEVVDAVLVGDTGRHFCLPASAKFARETAECR